jgi:hypothetical protein
MPRHFRWAAGAAVVLLLALLAGCAGRGFDWPSARLFPRFAATRRVWVLHVPPGASSAELVALASLQGVVNRPRPRLYVVANADDTFWLQHALPGVAAEDLPAPGCALPAPAAGASAGFQQLMTLSAESDAALLCAVLQRFPGAVGGLVVYDPALPASEDVGTTLAGLDDAMLVTPDQAPLFEGAPFHLKVLADLTTYGWTSADQAYAWAWSSLWPRAQHRLLFSLDPRIALNLREYAVATRGYVFWLDPRNAGDAALLRQILTAAAPDAPVLGWWTDEPSGVALGSRYGHATLATDFSDNLSVFGAFPEAGGLRQTAAAAAPAPAAGGVYFSVQFSDGDNMQYMQHRLLQIWRDPQRASVPVAYTVQPWAAQAMPTILEYYYRTAGAGDLFVTGPSGAGYFYPEDWPSGSLAAWLQAGAPLLRREDIRLVEVWNFKAPDLAAYAQALRPSALLLGGGARNGTIRRADGTVEITNVGFPDTVAQAEALLRPLAAGAGAAPAFANLYVDAWTWTPGMVAQLEAALGSGFHLVRADQLVAMWAAAAG